MNLNRDRIKYFEVKTDSNGSRTRDAMWALSLKLKDKLENVKLERGVDLLLKKKNLNVRESKEGEKEIKHSNLLLLIPGVPSIGIH